MRVAWVEAGREFGFGRCVDDGIVIVRIDEAADSGRMRREERRVGMWMCMIDSYLRYGEPGGGRTV